KILLSGFYGALDLELCGYAVVNLLDIKQEGVQILYGDFFNYCKSIEIQLSIHYSKFNYKQF
ncbi:1981_t:CDS:1, partial [Scutellospora calospora]